MPEENPPNPPNLPDWGIETWVAVWIIFLVGILVLAALVG